MEHRGKFIYRKLRRQLESEGARQKLQGCTLSPRALQKMQASLARISHGSPLYYTDSSPDISFQVKACLANVVVKDLKRFSRTE